jgi:dipeptidyl aminopeptidase/acylaminoacyl peptidase
MREQRPYGSWKSPFPTNLLVEGRPSLADVRFDQADGSITWVESRPWDDGRNTLVRWTREEGTADVSPHGLNVRDRVHEYGGAPYVANGGLVVVSDATGPLHRVAPDRTSQPLTPDADVRYADLVLDEARGRLVAVREDHAGPGEPVNAIVSVPLDGSEPSIVVEGSDFYSAPRISPDGSKLAWLRWDHPNLPWDGTELCVGRLDDEGKLLNAEVVAGSAGDWVTQPRWSPHGILYFVAEPNGYMNLHRLIDGRVEAVISKTADFARADWAFGQSNYGFLPDGGALAIGRSGGQDRLYRSFGDGRPVELLDVPFREMSSLDTFDGIAVFDGASPAMFSSVVRFDPADSSHEILRRTSPAQIDPRDISIPESVEFPTTEGRTAHAIYYPPANQKFSGFPGERPPLVVSSHGGPTDQAYTGLTVTFQHFTSRGLGFLDVDYGGSTGYGREYRKRLEGAWGVTDVDDCVMGAQFLAERGDIDPQRRVVRGGSAGGFTTLAALAFRDAFQAGISYFGIGNLKTFSLDTHKFESRYCDCLVGPLPQAEALYAERSPSLHADQIAVPVLVIQGADDQVVPPSEAEAIVAALAKHGVPHCYLLIPGEDHGFRKAENILRSFEAELSFLSQVFDFELADEIEPIELVGASSTEG